MWGTEVTIRGRSYFVMGTPSMSDAQLLERAMRQAEAQEYEESRDSAFYSIGADGELID